MQITAVFKGLSKQIHTVTQLFFWLIAILYYHLQIYWVGKLGKWSLKGVLNLGGNSNQVYSESLCVYSMLNPRQGFIGLHCEISSKTELKNKTFISTLKTGDY